MVVIKDKTYREDIYEKRMAEIRYHDSHYLWANPFAILFGIVALILSLIPGYNVLFGSAVGGIGIIFALIGKGAYDNRVGNKAFIMNIIAIVIGIVWYFVFVNVLFPILPYEYQVSLGELCNSAFQMVGLL